MLSSVGCLRALLACWLLQPWARLAREPA
uniref:Uncharacterized protein n=1 Tax=Arundo donax TaxID=35708 RepID=A0A0A8ZXN0_ARUDO